MRRCHVLALFVAPFALAVPPAPPGKPALATSPPQSSWRWFSNQIIARIWGNDEVRVDKQISSHGSSAWSRYGQDIVVRFNLSSAADATAISEASRDLFLDVWEFSANWVDIRLPKKDLPILLDILPSNLHTAYAPLMPHMVLADAIYESRSDPSSSSPKSQAKDVFFSEYQPLSVITPWMQLMASMFPSHVSLFNIGISWEGRDIPALRIGVRKSDDDDEDKTPRKTIVVSGGIHAREWISTSSVLYVANQIINSYGKDPKWTRLVHEFDWILVPTLNPDGYVYTWETDRLWRKNRQTTSLRWCRGIDLDRAFGFEWNGDADATPCSESYAGDEAWQAVEAQRFADWAKNETESGNAEILALLDLHSYSQQVLYPYSFSCKAAPPTLEDLEELGLGIAKAMRMTPHGHVYKTTSACEGNVLLSSSDEPDILPRIESGGGSLLDWFYHNLKIRYAYQIKLRDTGSYGFLLPKENIIPQGKEVFSAVTYLGKFLAGTIGMTEEEPAPTSSDTNEADIELLLLEQWELKKRRR